MQAYDYVIVGAGAAGCLLANRLTEDPSVSVCLLEAGAPDRNPYIHIPAGFIKVGHDPAYTWDFLTEPGPGIDGRQVITRMGRTLGGSSSINGFNYTRGAASDFDNWAELGNAGWSYADVLPYFKRTEKRLAPHDAHFRGSEGLLPITNCDWRHPLCDAFIEAAAGFGMPSHIDYNAASQQGAGYYQRWIQNGRRVSAARAFLKPARARAQARLEVRTHAQATRILFEGKRAVGVQYQASPNAPVQTVRATREVILSAGAANTPKLLQLSGIGPEAVLGELGIPVFHALEGVGENFHDHFMVRSVVRVQGVQTINSTARGVRLIGEILKWALGRPSVLAISPSVAFGFAGSRPELTEPDLQLHFSPGSYAAGIAGRLDQFAGMTLGFYQQRPYSVGHVRARSTNPFELPRIQPNYLTDPRDQQTAIDGLRLARAILHSPPLAKYGQADDFPPASAQTDAELLACARERGGTAWHFMGTCKMGQASDPTAVVDSELRVLGLEGLRVVDASVMPSMTSGNTGAPTMMIAEKAADFIRGNPQLPAERR
ncbi:BetA Choline dehydrogenase and related flavoproteins [Burkholderiaceae bacterium]